MSLKFPKTLIRENYFISPIWYADAPEFIEELNEASEPYIQTAKEKIQKDMGTKGDFGSLYHSKSLMGEPKFKEFENYIGATSVNLLNEQGYDLTNYKVFITEMWVQEFAKDGGGHHTLHTHWNGHISGFYFLKASEKTSKPRFQDPRHGRMMNMLPEKSEKKLSYASWEIDYKIKAGRLVFFPSYLPHLYVVDAGHEPFRFIHFNCQAISKGVLKA